MRSIFAALVLICALAGWRDAARAQDDSTVPESAGQQSTAPEPNTPEPNTPKSTTDAAQDGTRPLQERCIPLRRVRKVRIVDGKTIIWEVAGGPVSHYKMTLSSKCPGLVGRGAFVHSSSGSRLCDVGEWIRVAGGTRAICSIDRIEPWTPPDKTEKPGKTEKNATDSSTD